MILCPGGVHEPIRRLVHSWSGRGLKTTWSEQGNSGRSAGHIHSAEQAFGCVGQAISLPAPPPISSRDPCAQCTYTEAKTHHCTCLHRHLSATTCQLLHCDHPQLLLTLLYCDLPHQSADPCYLCLPDSATTTQDDMMRQQPKGMAHQRRTAVCLVHVSTAPVARLTAILRQVY